MAKRIALAAILFFAISSLKAEASMLITWKAATLAPNSYPGKHLPTANSNIKAYLDLIEAGRNVDISNQEIEWYLNDNYLAGGKGMKSVSFTAPEIAGGNLELRAEMPNRQVLKTVEIPVVKPLVIIESGLKDGYFSNQSILLKGTSYFFNTKDSINLNFDWTVNGASPENSGDPEILNISLNGSAPDNFRVNVNLAVSNSLRGSEVGGANTTLIYKK